MDTGRAMEAAKKELHSRPGMQAPFTEANISSLDSASGESLNAVSKYKQARGRRPPPVESVMGVARQNTRRVVSCIQVGV